MKMDILYNNMIYIDDDKGFVFRNGTLTDCYERIYEVIQYEDDKGELQFKIKYRCLDYCAGEYELLDEEEVYEVKQFQKITVINIEVKDHDWEI